MRILSEETRRGSWTFCSPVLGMQWGLEMSFGSRTCASRNGGGSFHIPYFLMLAIIGIPTFLLELKIGQYSAKGPVTLYSHLSPLFKGLGFVNFIAQCFVGLYYNMIIAWTIYYFFASLTSELPWQYCHNDYNDQGKTCLVLLQHRL